MARHIASRGAKTKSPALNLQHEGPSAAHHRSMTTSTPPPIHLYAELLVHINAVSLHGSIHRPDAVGSTTATLSTDGPLIRVAHAGSTATLQLPVKTSASTSSTVQLPAGKPKEFTARLQVEADDLARTVSLREDVESETPWGAKDLTGETRLYCRGCRSGIVNNGVLAQKSDTNSLPEGNSQVQEWKDLPSDNWAEMMDFWHCHKPVDHKKTEINGTASSQKGYAASNTLQAVPGVGLVDTSSFLFAPEDVTSVQVVHDTSATSPSSSVSSQAERLICASPDCAQLLGHVDTRASGYRLFKWAVAVQQNDTSKRLSFPAEQWIATQMLSMLEAESIRKFIVTRPVGNSTSPVTNSDDIPSRSAHDEQEESWLLWLFAPDLRFCSSASSPPLSSAADPGSSDEHSSTVPAAALQHMSRDCTTQEPAQSIRACKILYRRLPTSSSVAPATISSTVSPASQPLVTSPTGETLTLPPPLNEALFDAIFSSAALLPRAARTYGPWQVGLLRRFAREDLLR